MVVSSLPVRVVGDRIGSLGWDHDRVLDEVDGLIAMVNGEASG